jgi:drug/metabolite transporter (DMT)-like permease
MGSVTIVWVVLTLIWGSTWIFIKLGLRDLPPITFAGLRFLIAAAVLCAIALSRRARLPRGRDEWSVLAWSGLIAIGFNYGLIFWGEVRISSGLAALLQSTIPVFGLLLAHWYLPTERMTVRKLLGVLTGLAGVGVIFYDQLQVDGVAALQGGLALLLSSVCVAYGNVLVKARLTQLDPSVLAASQMVFGCVPLLILGWWMEGSPWQVSWTPLAVVSLTYLALIGSALAFLLYYWLVIRIEVTRTMLISLVIPVVALLLGYLTMGERLSSTILLGSGSILGGISLILFPYRRGPVGGRS